MGIESKILEADAIESALQTLKAIQTYERNKRTHGLGRVELYFRDVEGDWLETWGEDDELEKLAIWREKHAEESAASYLAEGDCPQNPSNQS